LTSKDYQHEITFIPEDYIRSNWSKWFEVVEIFCGVIYDFQDVVVLKAI
jgi:hypothetical protein